MESKGVKNFGISIKTISFNVLYLPSNSEEIEQIRQADMCNSEWKNQISLLRQ